MWLQYALDKDGNLVSVYDVPRGRSDIRCPYCQGELTAKKGKIKAHHFAHLNDTCNHVQTSDSVSLPLYDRFDLGIDPKILKILINYWEKNPDKNSLIRVTGRGDYLEDLGVVSYNSYRNNGRGGYEFTKLGLLALGGLSLMLFNQVQEPRIIEKLEEIEENLVDFKDYLLGRNLSESTTRLRPRTLRPQVSPLAGEPRLKELSRAGMLGKPQHPSHSTLEEEKQTLQELTIDYQIYLLQYRRILSNSLYFLEIKADDELYHKIGVTTRNIEPRISEIKRDLALHFSSVSIKGLGVWSHRGNVEYYFKYRYRKFNHPIGSLTEYFKFDGDVKSVLRDLRRMKPKQLSQIEQEILGNKPFDKTLLSLYIRHGMQKSKDGNIHIGRPKGETESTKQFLAKPKNQAITTVLKKGLSVRQTAKVTNASVNTVRKVRRLLGMSNHIPNAPSKLL